MACFFCGSEGHWVRSCPAKAIAKAGCTPAIVCEPISSTRTRKTTLKTLEDLLYDNHVCVQVTWMDDVKAFVKRNFKNDGCALAEHLFENMYLVNPNDLGHLKIIGYMVAVYCDAGDPSIKGGMRLLKTCFNTRGEFTQVCKKFFGLIPVVNQKTGSMSFRKFTGLSFD